jgi:hypothetical protein
MPRKKITREEQIAKMRAFVESTRDAMYPEGKIKVDNNAAKAQAAIARALDALRDAANYQAAHTEALNKHLDALKAELAA